VPRILLVEDEDTIGTIVSDTLTLEGYDVRRAKNGGEGIDFLRCWVPRLILLDLMMPVMDGSTFRTEQRKLAGDVASVPLIVVSAARKARARAAELGAVAALSKPFDLAEVTGALARWVHPGRPDPEWPRFQQPWSSC